MEVGYFGPKRGSREVLVDLPAEAARAKGDRVPGCFVIAFFGIVWNCEV